MCRGRAIADLTRMPLWQRAYQEEQAAQTAHIIALYAEMAWCIARTTTESSGTETPDVTVAREAYRTRALHSHMRYILLRARADATHARVAVLRILESL